MNLNELTERLSGARITKVQLYDHPDGEVRRVELAPSGIAVRASRGRVTTSTTSIGLSLFGPGYQDEPREGVRELLEQVHTGALSPDEAMAAFDKIPAYQLNTAVEPVAVHDTPVTRVSDAVLNEVERQSIFPPDLVAKATTGLAATHMRDIPPTDPDQLRIRALEAEVAGLRTSLDEANAQIGLGIRPDVTHIIWRLVNYGHRAIGYQTDKGYFDVHGHPFQAADDVTWYTMPVRRDGQPTT